MCDYTPYKELYLKCFTEDTPAEAEFLFENVLSKVKLLSKEENGQLVAMLFLIDCFLVDQNKKYPFYYLYAACTHPDFRGKGIMADLLSKAKEKALSSRKLGIFLKPATLSLFDFYDKNGFNPFFAFSKIETSKDNFLNKVSESLPFENIQNDDWYYLRKSLLPSLCDIYVDFSQNLFDGATQDCKAAKNDKAGVIYEIRDKTLLIKEALFEKGAEKDLLKLVSSILKKITVEKLELRMPPIKDNQPFSPLRVKTAPFSVIWQKDGINLSNYNFPYHGFAFD